MAAAGAVVVAAVADCGVVTIQANRMNSAEYKHMAPVIGIDITWRTAFW